MTERLSRALPTSVLLCALTILAGCRDASAPNAAGTRTCSADQVKGASIDGTWVGEKDMRGIDAGELRVVFAGGRWIRTEPRGKVTEGIYLLSPAGALTARSNGMASSGAYPLKAWLGNDGNCMYLDDVILWRQPKP
jgi:hypothetical protein